MKKANLLCPRERVFFKGLLVSKPSIPTEKMYNEETTIVEVDVLEEVDEKVLILLPNLLSDGTKRTAIVNAQYLL